VVLGREKFAELLYDVGYNSAYYWCSHEATTHGLSGLAVFEHYLKRLSQRGYGKFSFANVDVAAGTADIRLHHSMFVLGCPGNRGRLCYMFSGCFAAAMDWVLEQGARPMKTICSEIQCGAEGHPNCSFCILPRNGSQPNG
jgi:predicted hydrocarbon binding protein